MKTTERVLWLIVGASIGAGIALLYAPKSGRDTRRLLRRKAEDARDALAETGEQIRDRVAGTTESLMDAGRDMYRRASASPLFEAGRRAVNR